MSDSQSRRLHAIRADYGAGEEKANLIEQLDRRPPRSFNDIVCLHDDLLFLRAFPDSRRVLDAATRSLARFDRVVAALGRARHRANDTGLTGTESRGAFAFATAAALNVAFPGELDIDWPAVTNESAIDGLLRPTLRRAEEDAFDSGEISTRKWLALRIGKRAETGLTWLLRSAPKRGAARRAFQGMYDAAEVPVRWRLGHSQGSATHTALHIAKPVFRATMRRPPPDIARHVASPTRAIELLPHSRARDVIDVARTALASRGREVFAIYTANPHEVYLADLGQGAAIAIIGVQPEYRMSLEANYGYLMLSNGVPVGYGGVTPLYRQANTGLNIFPSFRGSEAAYLWIAALRVFRSLFHVRRFLVNAKQVGEGNSEAIASGAFWFYYRLGFRPAQAKTRALAAREFRLLQRGQRTAASTLRALAHGDLYLDLSGMRDRAFFDEAWLVDRSRQATAQLAAEGPRSADSAARSLANRVAQALDAGARDRWPAAERDAFEQIAPVCAQLPGMARWNDRDRRAMVALMRAKGRPQERDFVLAAQADRRFYPGLIRLAATP